MLRTIKLNPIVTFRNFNSSVQLTGYHGKERDKVVINFSFILQQIHPHNRSIIINNVKKLMTPQEKEHYMVSTNHNVSTQLND